MTVRMICLCYFKHYAGNVILQDIFVKLLMKQLKKQNNPRAKKKKEKENKRQKKHSETCHVRGET